MFLLLQHGLIFLKNVADFYAWSSSDLAGLGRRDALIRYQRVFLYYAAKQCLIRFLNFPSCEVIMDSQEVVTRVQRALRLSSSSAPSRSISCSCNTKPSRKLASEHRVCVVLHHLIMHAHGWKYWLLGKSRSRTGPQPQRSPWGYPFLVPPTSLATNHYFVLHFYHFVISRLF